ncbi:MAG: antibiotic biosynthesis monooxygenase [Sphingomonadaceae bacterium]
MSTLLSIQTVAEGREEEYLKIQREVWSQTHAKEPGIVRYEHYRGEKPGQFYSLLVFRDFGAFLDHQVADYHDAPDWAGCSRSMKCRYWTRSPAPATWSKRTCPGWLHSDRSAGAVSRSGARFSVSPSG